MMGLSKEQMEEYEKHVDECMKKYGFYVHALKNGEPDDFTGIAESIFKPGLCNIHTHGLNEIGHPEFRIVCDSDMDIKKLHRFISGMANDVIKNHERYTDGDSLFITQEDDSDSTINSGYFINDIDEENVLRFIRTYNISEELIHDQQLPLEQMMVGNKGVYES